MERVLDQAVRWVAHAAQAKTKARSIRRVPDSNTGKYLPAPPASLATGPLLLLLLLLRTTLNADKTAARSMQAAMMRKTADWALLPVWPVGAEGLGGARGARAQKPLQPHCVHSA